MWVLLRVSEIVKTEKVHKNNKLYLSFESSSGTKPLSGAVFLCPKYLYCSFGWVGFGVTFVRFCVVLT